MYYLCFASRTDGHIKPAKRILVFVTETKTQFRVNLELAKKRYPPKNYQFECVTISHLGHFHFGEEPID